MRTQTVLFAAFVLAAWLSNVSHAQEGWRTGPDYPAYPYYDVRTVYDHLPEHRLEQRGGYWTWEWATNPYTGQWQQMRMWVPHYTFPAFTGRVTLQPQRRGYYTYTTGNTVTTGWTDLDWLENYPLRRPTHR